MFKPPTSHPIQAFVAHNKFSPQILHQRLGHPSHARLQHLSQLIPEVNFDASLFCEFHPLEKQTHLPFSSSYINSNKPFDLIHCDIWGGHFVASLSRAHYFLTIVDDFSHCTWVYLMRFKSETNFFLKSFFRMVEAQFGCRIKCICFDNGVGFFPMN